MKRSNKVNINTFEEMLMMGQETGDSIFVTLWILEGL